MFDKRRVITGLETGTTKIRVAVGEQNDAGAVNIIHVGEAESNGVVKGEIVNARVAIEDIRNALADAEEKANAELSTIILGVTGAHVGSTDNRGAKRIISMDRSISQDDVDYVIKEAKAISLQTGQCLIHCIRHGFTIDDEREVPEPVGMVGGLLTTEVHVIFGSNERANVPIRLVKELELTVDDVAFNGLASAMAMVPSDHKELGALAIDIGAGTTEFVVYSGRIIEHTGVIAVGGHNVTNDISIGLRISQLQAEQLKLKHGAAVVDDSVRGQIITLPHEPGIEARTINLEHLRLIESVRLQEIFELIAADLAEHGLLGCIGAGVYLCGGVSRTPRIRDLAEKIFKAPVLSGKNDLSGPTSVTAVPEFQAAIGLVRYGASQRERARRAPKESFVERLAVPIIALNPFRAPSRKRF
jgi:cell division protein FtsA